MDKLDEIKETQPLREILTGMSTGTPSPASQGYSDNSADSWYANGSVDILPANSRSEPWVEITEQPQERGHRFRYKCEGKSHGVIKGARSEGKNRTFPSIKIHNYSGPALIRVTVVHDSGQRHDNELTGPNANDPTKPGVYQITQHVGTAPIVFKDLSILHVKQQDAKAKRLQLGLITEEEMKSKNKKGDKNAKMLRLKFDVTLVLQNGVARALNPVISDRIYDGKGTNTSELKIKRLSKYTSPSTGLDEVFLLCDRVNKDDIKVRFFEINSKGKIVWEAYGEFGHLDVHYQVVIVFRTPQYLDGNINGEKHVQVQLERPSDGECSEGLKFTYRPAVSLDEESVSKKRKKPIPDITQGVLAPKKGGRGRKAKAQTPHPALSQATVINMPNTTYASPASTGPYQAPVMTSPQNALYVQSQPFIQPATMAANQVGSPFAAAQQQPNRTVVMESAMNSNNNVGYASPPQGYTSPQHGYTSPQQGITGQPQGYFSPPQSQASPPQGYASPQQGGLKPDITELQPVQLQNQLPQSIEPGQVYEFGGIQYLADESRILVEISSIIANSPPELIAEVLSPQGSPQMDVVNDNVQQIQNPMQDYSLPVATTSAATGLNVLQSAMAQANLPTNPNLPSSLDDIQEDFYDHNADTAVDDIGSIARQSHMGPMLNYGNKKSGRVDDDDTETDDVRTLARPSKHFDIASVKMPKPDETKNMAVQEERYESGIHSMYESGLGSLAPDAPQPELEEENEPNTESNPQEQDNTAKPDEASQGSDSKLEMTEKPEPVATKATDTQQSAKEPQSEEEAAASKAQEAPTTTTTNTSTGQETENTEKPVLKCTDPCMSDRDRVAVSGNVVDAKIQQLTKYKTGLQSFAQTGDIKYLLALFRHLIKLPDGVGDNALHLAVIHRQIEPLRYLLLITQTIYNLDAVNARNDQGQTPLHLAVICKEDYMVELLMEYGARMDMSNAEGYTALHLAAKMGEHRCVQSLLTKCKDRAVLQHTLHKLDYDGFAPLHRAIQCGSMRCVEHLVSAGTDVNVRDGKSGYTPLHEAAQHEHSNIVGYLLMQRDIQPNVPGYNDATALHEAASTGNLGIVAAIVAAGGDPEAESSEPLEADSDDDTGTDEDKDKDTTEAAEEDDNQKFLTPIDIAQGNHKMLRILRGESYSEVRERNAPVSPDSAMLSSLIRSTAQLSIHTETLSTLDIVTRIKLGQLLDPEREGADWMALAKIFKMDFLIDILKTMKSPTSALLDNLEAMDSTVLTLQEKLVMLGREDAVRVIEEALAITHRAKQEHLQQKSEEQRSNATKLPGGE